MKKENKSRWLNRFKMKMRKNPTIAEKAFYTALTENNIRFRFQSLCYSDDFQCIVDFLIKSDGQNIAIEIDGGYHETDSQRQKDLLRTKWLKTHRNYDIVRFTNDDVLNNPNQCLTKLATYYVGKVKNSMSNNFLSFCKIIF